MANFNISSARSALVVGLILCGALLSLWLVDSRIDMLGLVSFLARFVHVLSAIVWVGMIWFVNFIQLAAGEEADDAGRQTILKLVAPRVAFMFRYASHVSLASGAVLLVTTGYMLDRWVFASAVYVPPLKAAFLWGGTVAAMIMWIIAHTIIWPNLKVLMSPASDAERKADARARIRWFARLNLVLALPVTFVMVGGAHLY